MPLNKHIDTRHQQKTQKYTPFITDITGYKCTLNCFEISSTGFINSRNRDTLHTLHSFMKKDLKRSVFMLSLIHI